MSGRGGDGLDLAQLRTFLAVYRAGSVTAAARLVGLSQPTVTTQLQELEKRLGSQLFERLPRGVAPTATADELAMRLAGPMDALEEIAGGVAGAPAAQPSVRLAGPAEMLGALALPALAPTIARGVRLTVDAGPGEALLTGLRAGRYDLVITTVRPRGRTVRAEPLLHMEFLLVGAPEVASRIDPIELRGSGTGFGGVALVGDAEELPLPRRYWRQVFGVRLDAEPAVVVADLRSVAAVVVAGGGIGVLPRYLIAAQLDSGALVPLLEPAQPPVDTVFLARRVGAPALAHVDLVHDTLIAAGRGW
ncbi:LysR family transcriptional regulator [Nocardia sp. CDC159]|uniref:LysR family transcriptional regulator n=1 Tax=Nocardia pulmonis TaxID=2951408 RepID=A0A9X2EHF7_9NOCA|nr:MULTISPECIES: LysR family transcriptional regulator [Nocardia]MCM6778156.1 LysR family transcriptional regulator [Nocardia pulmonis]MCM6791045.1 LysR family transcriptional regulator [Nocardia sp. CDC159]